MKIEKINDNQIRCTLSKEDLADRNIKLSELAYGTGKTRELFQDMMQQANEDFGFEVNDIPLMVEAIPVSPETIVLVITKVDNPSQTEEHLSKFFSKEMKEGLLSHLEDIEMNLTDFEEIDNDMEAQKTDASSDDKNEDNENSILYSTYIFDNLSQIITVSKILLPLFEGESSVYKSPFNDKYYLSLCMASIDDNRINRIFSTLTEHGVRENPSYAKEFFYLEHFDEIIPTEAIETLAQL